MNDELITQALLSEFAEMRAELRTMLTGSTATLNIGIALIAAVVSLSSFLKDLRILFLVPTTMFVGAMIQLSYGTTISGRTLKVPQSSTEPELIPVTVVASFFQCVQVA